jgi:uncharacterized protein (DUF1697 family)
MKTYVVLLRGVMPYGKNKVPMAQLRQVLTDAGFEEVRTYIQSGNVVLRTKLSPSALEKRVHKIIKGKIGPDLVVVVRTGRQLMKILDDNPMRKEDMSRVFFTVFAGKPPAQKVKELLAQDFTPEEIIIRGMHAYVYIPHNAARSQLSNNILEKKLGVSATTRNRNTLTRLIEMSIETTASL